MINLVMYASGPGQINIFRYKNTLGEEKGLKIKK